MGKNILYVTNYYLDDVIKQRHSEGCISQAGQNKGKYIMDMLAHGGNHVTVWSNAWTSSRSFRFYKGFRSKENPNIYYSDIFGAPLLNAYTCLFSSKKFLRRYVKEHKIDAIVFYNMRLENSKLALYAKKKFGIPIILQYEDGLTSDAHISGLKRFIYERMEHQVMEKLDGAFLVNSKIEVPCPSVVIRGAIRENMVVEKQSGAVEKTPRVLFSSTLDKQRGIEVLLEALKHTKTEFTLKISGRGECETQVASCKDSRVDFLGYISYEQLQEEMQQADICINAQLAHHEFGNFSFPSKIFEYLSAGKLVVSSDVADAEEALGDTLLIYHEDSPVELARTLEQAISICKNPTERQTYQRKIEAVIRENSMDAVAAKVNHLLEEITDK